MEKEKGIKILHLTLKKHWFDMIASGEKKEEYRQDKMYWKQRFVKEGYWHSQTCKDFDIVRFKNGYAKDAPTVDVECKSIRLADLHEVNPNWFGSFREYEGCRIFIITLGEILLSNEQSVQESDTTKFNSSTTAK